MHRPSRSDQLRLRRTCTSSRESCSFGAFGRDSSERAAARVLLRSVSSAGDRIGSTRARGVTRRLSCHEHRRATRARRVVAAGGPAGRPRHALPGGGTSGGEAGAAGNSAHGSAGTGTCSRRDGSDRSWSLVMDDHGSRAGRAQLPPRWRRPRRHGRPELGPHRGRARHRRGRRRDAHGARLPPARHRSDAARPRLARRGEGRPTARPDPRRCNAHDRRPSTPSRSPSLKGGASRSLCGRARRRRRSASRRPLGSVLRRRRGIVACRRSAAGPISAGSGSTRAALTWHRERTGSAPAAQACPPTAAAALRTSVVAPAGVGRHDASTSSCSSSHGSRSSGAIAGDM